MQLEIFILLLSSPFPYLLRLWGRRKVHSPPPTFLYALKSLVYPVSTVWQKGAFPLCDSRAYGTGEIAPLWMGHHSWFLLSTSALFLVLFFLVGCG